MFAGERDTDREDETIEGTKRERGHGLAAVALAIAMASLLVVPGCRRPGRPTPEVVVYTALDRGFSEPIFRQFERDTGITVRPKYDTESTKTVGLVNAIRAEARRPRCDVFWNNEIVNTIRLQQEGLLAPYRSPAAEAFPAAFRDAAGHWSGFAARARVIIVNNDLVPPGGEPKSMYDLAQPKWRGRFGLAKPLFGTTATHVACLFAKLGEAKAKELLLSLKANRVSVESGNKTCALKVATGELACAVTDTDDAVIEIEKGKPVRLVYPDSAPGQMGTLFIPNTLSLVSGGPNPAAGRRLIDYLLSPKVEAALAQCPSSQIPLNPAVGAKARVKTPADVVAMEVDFAAAARAFEGAAEFVREQFLR